MKAHTTLILAALHSLPRAIQAALSCNKTHNPCSDLLYEGSQCIDGYCSNPFQGGCLQAFMKSPQYETKYGEAASEELQALRKRILSKPRVCNSDDGEDVMKKGLCIPSESDYEEVRVYGQNWESGFVMAWMLQIVYSELLGVPSTIESGTGDAKINFYDAMNRMEYGTGNDVDVIENAYNAEGGDCSVYRDREEYMPCANVVVEVYGLLKLGLLLLRAGLERQQSVS